VDRRGGKTGMPPACGVVTVAFMDVTFTKVAGRRYLMTVVRERGPRLAPRHGPGYDDYLPHDAVHFLVEAEARLPGGVFGQIAAGQSNIFWAADPKGLRRQARREAKRIPTAAERADMGRSEALAGCCQPLWELRGRSRPRVAGLVVERDARHAGVAGVSAVRTHSGASGRVRRSLARTPRGAQHHPALAARRPGPRSAEARNWSRECASRPRLASEKKQP
jgi:hypothetical protein